MFTLINPTTHPAKKINQMDSENKCVGYSYMSKKKFINQPKLLEKIDQMDSENKNKSDMFKKKFINQP